MGFIYLPIIVIFMGSRGIQSLYNITAVGTTSSFEGKKRICRELAVIIVPLAVIIVSLAVIIVPLAVIYNMERG